MGSPFHPHQPIVIWTIQGHLFYLNINLVQLNILLCKRCPNHQFDELSVYFLSNSLNYVHSKIKLIHDEENASCMTFLDLSITKCNHKFLTIVYRKPTSHSFYIHRESRLPFNESENLEDFFSGAFKIRSTEVYYIFALGNKNGNNNKLLQKWQDSAKNSINKIPNNIKHPNMQQY